MDSWEKFNEKSLPSKKDFYSVLTLEDITDKDHAHALKIWEVFGGICQGICQYVNLHIDMLKQIINT